MSSAADARSERTAGGLHHAQQGGQGHHQLCGQKTKGRLPRLAVEEIERAEHQRREAHGNFGVLQLHPAVIVQVDGRGLANIIVPVAVRDAVDQLFLAKGRLHVAAGGFLHRLLILAVKVVVIKASVCVGAGLALGWAAPGTGSPAEERHRSSGSALRCAGCAHRSWGGAQSIVFVRERPFIARAMGGGVDAAAKLFVALAVIGCAAVRADHDIIGQRQRSAAAFTGTAIIFRYDFLLLYGSYWYYTPLKEKKR